jgi:hypothetical protein
MRSRRLPIARVFASLSLLALSCGGSAQQPAAAYVLALLGPGGSCNARDGTTLLQLGEDPGTELPVTVADGEDGITLKCLVRSDGDGFDLHLQAAASGGGSIVIASRAGRPVTMLPGTPGVDVTFDGTAAGLGSLEGTDCSFDVSDARSYPPIAPKRVWGHVWCPSVADPSQPSPGTVADGCQAEAYFVFEQCEP